MIVMAPELTKIFPVAAQRPQCFNLACQEPERHSNIDWQLINALKHTFFDRNLPIHRTNLNNNIPFLGIYQIYKTGFRYLPVRLFLHSAISSGVPAATI